MTLFLQATMQGLALGAVYSFVAIGLVLIYKATDVLSFAQPALAVAGAGIISALAVDRGISFWIALPLGIFITGVLGLIIERTFLRAMVGEPVFSVAILTIGIDILIRTVLDNWIGLNPRYMGDSFSQMGNFGSLNIGGVAIQFLELTALLSAIAVIVLQLRHRTFTHGVERGEEFSDFIRFQQRVQEDLLTLPTAENLETGNRVAPIWILGGTNQTARRALVRHGFASLPHSRRDEQTEGSGGSDRRGGIHPHWPSARQESRRLPASHPSRLPVGGFGLIRKFKHHGLASPG